MPKKKISAPPAPSESLIRRVSTWRSGSVLVLALLALTTALLYWRALGCGIISDGWVVLAIGSIGPLEAMQVRLSYHIIPVTFLLTSILWKLFGLWEPGYQLANLAQLAISAWMLYLLGLRLFGRVRIALLAALLLVANASFYEVTFWPVIGNFQILAGFLQIGGVLAALKAADSPRSAARWGWSALFALLALAAFFTYEPAVSLLAAGPLAAAFLSPGGGAVSWRTWSDWRDRIRRALPVLIASVLAFLPMVVAKVLAEKSGETAMFFPESLDAVRIRIQFLVRACIAIFTLRGHELTTGGLFHLGLPPFAYGSPGYHLVLGFWAALLGAVTLLALFRVRHPAQPAVIFLTLWFWIHVSSVSIATIIVSRQYYLAALPAMLLLAWGISRAADVLGARVWPENAPRAAALSASAAFLVFGLLAAGAKSDIDTAAAVYRDATLDARRIVEIARQRIASGTTPQSIALLDLPAHRVRQGIGIYPFVNGTHEMLKLTLGDVVPRHQIHLYSTQEAVREGYFASATRPISLPELDRLVDDPSWLVMRYDEPTGTVVRLDSATWRAPREYTAASAPYLQWQEGGWPWFRQAAGQPLEMPLALPAPETWGAVKFLRPDKPLQFDFVEAGTPRLQVRSPRVQTPYWPVLAFPLGEEDGETVLTLRPETEVWLAGLWTFAPPVRYTPASAPFLDWIPGGEPSFAVYEPTRLPVETEGCASSPCRIRIGYVAAPERELAVAVEGGERRELAPVQGETPGWRTVTLAAPAGEDTAVVRIEPRGPLPALLNRIEIETPAKVDASAPNR